MNLCTNAYQAMRTTGGALRVEVCETRLDDAFLARHPELSSKHCIALTVSDTGSGIEPDHLGRIFEPYFTTKGPSEGTGLGLAIVHGIVKNHNGLITVTSELGKGTRFTVYLPAHQELKPRESEEVVFPLPNLHGSVMFVDDEADIAEMVRTALSKTGASVASFTDSLAAFKAFEDAPEAFDVVITDQNMPHLSGLELARKILARRPDIPVILCTGFSETLNDQGIGSTAIRQLLEKPLNIDKLAWLIKNSLPEKK
jgi:CheY-like chemotaxis protein/anti-sigma regulatory factor (Ser/Thr protein kinase)